MRIQAKGGTHAEGGKGGIPAPKGGKPAAKGKGKAGRMGHTTADDDMLDSEEERAWDEVEACRMR